MATTLVPAPNRSPLAPNRFSPRVHALGAAGGRGAALGGAALVLALVQSLDPDRALFVCPLRAVTGVPCPFCGGTTAALAIARLDPVAALMANPFAVLGALLFVLAPLLMLARRPHRPGWASWPALGLATLALAEFWQLSRFDLI